MKKLLLTAFALTAAVGVFAQGTVNFQNRISATSLQTHVYLSPSTVNYSVTGNGTGDYPAGTTSWTGYTALSGSSYLAAIISAPSGTPDPKSPSCWGNLVAPFRTGAAAGYFLGGAATLGNVAKDAASASLQVFAWDNTSGLYATPAAAYTAWQNGLINAGFSSVLTVSAIGGEFNTPPNLTGLTSFNIYLVPEPTTMALAGLGAAALLIFRRRS